MKKTFVFLIGIMLIALFTATTALCGDVIHPSQVAGFATMSTSMADVELGPAVAVTTQQTPWQGKAMILTAVCGDKTGFHFETMALKTTTDMLIQLAYTARVRDAIPGTAAVFLDAITVKGTAAPLPTMTQMATRSIGTTTAKHLTQRAIPAGFDGHSFA